MDCWRRNGRKVLFETSDNINQFIRTLRDLNEIIEKRAKLNLLDNAVLAESFYKEILNALFSWKLENLNIEQSNFEAIDLIDDKNKIVVQISCTCENQKVHGTI
ncbi:MAG: SMEK domain-containing protein, partial [Streptococcus mutans]